MIPDIFRHSASDRRIKYGYSTGNYVTLIFLQLHVRSQAVLTHASFVTVESLCKTINSFLFLLNSAAVWPLWFSTHISTATILSAAQSRAVWS